MRSRAHGYPAHASTLLLLLGAAAAGCHRHCGDPDGVASAAGTSRQRAPAAERTSEPPAPPVAPPPTPAPNVSARLKGERSLATGPDRAGDWTLSVRNRDREAVLLAGRATLERKQGERFERVGEIALDGSCAQDGRSACRPLAPGAELLVSPLHIAVGDKGCDPLHDVIGDLPPERHRVVVLQCSPEDSANAADRP